MADRSPSDEPVAKSPTPSKPTSVRWMVLGLVALASTSAYLTRHCIAVANTTIQNELQLSTEQMGWILAAFAFGYFFCQVPGGWLGTQFGTRSALSLLSVLWSLFTVWTAAVSSYLPMLASRVAFGMAQAGLVPNSAKVINDWFPLKRRGLGSSAIGAAMSVGGVMTMGLTAMLLEHFTWRYVFIMYSLVGIVWSIAFYVLFRTKPSEHPWVNQAEVDLIVYREPPADKKAEETRAEAVASNPDSTSDRPTTEEPAVGSRILMRNMVSSLSMWAICLQSLFRAAGYGLFVTWFPAFLEKGYGVTRESAGLMTMTPLIGVVIGTPLGGLAVDFLLARTGSKRISRSGVGLSVLGLCGFCTLAASWTSSVGQLVAAIAVGAVFSGMGNPAAWATTMDMAGRYTAVVMGVMNMAGTVGGFITPALLGYMIGNIERTGGNWNEVIYLIAGIYFAGSLCWLLIDPDTSLTKPRPTVA